MRKARRSLTFLVVIIVGLAGLLAFGVARGEATWMPKLALDLQGGTQVLLAPKQTSGQTVTGEQLQQAVSIIRQRVDASGVSEAEITTQGNQNISVSIPGKADEATLQRIEASAKLDFRPVLAEGSGKIQMPTDAAQKAEAEKALAAQKQAAKDAEAKGELYPKTLPKGAGDKEWLTAGLQAQFAAFECTADSATAAASAPADRPLITCDNTGTVKYILGPVEMGGEVISDAVAQPETTQTGATTGGWAVQMTFDKKGTKTFGDISTRLYGAQPPFNQFAFVLDGSVLSAPTM
ncbi:preprotein translocase subunit SecD, partial [Leucobacter sp. OLES1]